MYFTEDDQAQIKKGFNFDPIAMDSLQTLDTLGSLKSYFTERGFLLAGVDAVSCSDSICIAYWYIGPRFTIKEILPGEIPEGVLRRLTPFLASDEVYHPSNLAIASDLISQYYADNGYPFVKLAVTPRINQEPTVNLHFAIEAGTYVEFDSIKLRGSIGLNSNYLQRYLGIRPGDPFSQTSIGNIQASLLRLPFIKSVDIPLLNIRSGKAKVIIPVKEQKISHFDFILGILPGNGDKKLQISGQAEAQLWNLFGQGEQIQASFYRTKPLTQEIKFRSSFPYIWKTAIGIDASLQLFKRDSSSLEIQTELGLQYAFTGGNYLKGFWQKQSANLVSIARNSILSSGKLPSLLDFRQHLFGFEGKWQNLDRPFNSRSGTLLWAKIGSGVKTIRKNQQIIDLSSDLVDFDTQYDLLALKSTIVRMEGNVYHFWPLGLRSTFMGQLQAAWIHNPSILLENELFRIGGYNLLRGFNEQSILASSYVVNTIEYRLAVQGNTYFNVFFDQGLIQNRIRRMERDYLFGIGAGIHLETKAGMLHLLFAVGKSPGTAISLGDAKIHVAYSSLF